MPSSATRKRNAATFLEPDELSQEKPKTPLSSSKRRKLNKEKSSSPKPRSGISAALGKLGGKVGGLLGFGKGGKENAAADDDEQDELAKDDDTNTHEGGKKDVFDVPSSPEPPSTSRRRNGLERTRVVTKSPGTVEIKSSASAKRTRGLVEKPKSDVYDFPDGEEEVTPRRSTKKPRATAERAKTSVELVAEDEPSPVRATPGRSPSKSKLLQKSKKIAKQDARERLAAADEEVEDSVDEEISTPRRRNKHAKNVVGSANGGTSLSKRKPGRPRKEEVVDLESAAHMPKSILTPSKRDRDTTRPKKSVVFENSTEPDLGFKDLDTSTKKSRKSRKVVEPKEASPEVADSTENVSDLQEEEEEEVAELEVEVEPDEIDDEICAICSDAKSTKKDPILFCDGCDYMVHQKCYGMTEVPEGDWFCKDCKPGTEDLAASNIEEAAGLPDIENFAKHLKWMQSVLLSRLTGRKRIKLRGHDEEMHKVHQIVEQTVLAGEGNSILVIGARGCGKTTLVESVIFDVSNDHRDDFHVVRLNGFIHTDDKLALKEIWRQLGREMEVDEDPSNKKSNYADTLASLLALLSHPSDFSGDQNQTAKSVIFILDEFDLFTTHSRQTLLYNLFDIAQAKKAPIAVLGLTTRIDVMDSLEKRVKSRFSHRYVHLTLPKSPPAFWEICKQGLVVVPDDLEADGLDNDLAGQDAFISYWNSMIEDLYAKDSAFKINIQSHFYTSKSVPSFFSSCILPISALSPKKFKLDDNAFASRLLSLSPPDSKLANLQGLSELELALLISAARLDIILDTDTCNFAMVYDEYSTLTSRHKIQTSSSGATALGSSAKVWGRDVALGAWERLADYDLLVPAVMGTVMKDSGVGGRMWRVDVGLEEIGGSVNGISSVMAKWCREI